MSGRAAASLAALVLACSGCRVQGEFTVLDQVTWDAAALPAKVTVYAEPPQLDFAHPPTFAPLLSGWHAVFAERLQERAAPVRVQLVPVGQAPAGSDGLRVETRIHWMAPTAVRDGGGDVVWAYATVLVRDLAGRAVWRGHLETYGSLWGTDVAKAYDLDLQVRLVMHNLACGVAALLRTGKPTGPAPKGTPPPWDRVIGSQLTGIRLEEAVVDRIQPVLKGAREKLAAAERVELAAGLDEVFDVLSRAVASVPPHPATDIDGQSGHAKVCGSLAEVWIWRGLLSSPEVAAQPSLDEATACFARALEVMAPFDASALLREAAVALWVKRGFTLRRHAGALIAHARGEVSQEARALLVRAADLYALAGADWVEHEAEARALAGP